MNQIIQRLLSQVYELEGLLHVLDREKGEAPQFLYEMVQDRVTKIAALAPDCTPEIFVENQEPQHDDIPADDEILDHDTEAVFIPEAPETIVTCDTPSFDDDERVDDDEPVADDVESVEDDEHYEPIVDEDDSHYDNHFVDMDYDFQHADDEADTDVQYIDTDDSDYIDDEADSVQFDDPCIFDHHHEPITHHHHSVALDDEPVCDDEPPVLPIDDDSEPVEEPIEEIVTVEEVLQRSISKNLSKAFTLNDHFRYRRELFGNSEVEMRNTINMVEAMNSFAEAEEYFYGDLEWDSESPEVKDFMTIIRNHFL